MLELGQVDKGVTTKAALFPTALMAGLELAPHALPSAQATRGKLLRGALTRSSSQAGDQPDGTAQHRARGGDFTPQDPAFMMTKAPKQLLETIVGGG